MKVYETLELEVIKFEAQDIITASVEIPVGDDTPVEDDIFNPENLPPLPDGSTNYEDWVWLIPNGSTEGMWVPADQVTPLV